MKVTNESSFFSDFVLNQINVNFKTYDVSIMHIIILYTKQFLQTVNKT